MRQIGDILILPFNFEMVQIGLNEFGTADNFNAAISKLDANLQYLISQTSLNGISVAYSPSLIPLSSILVNEEEFHDAFIYNKTFYKALYNNLEFRNKLWGQFYSNGSTGYIIDSWLYQYCISLNNYIGINELVAANVVNRCIGEIWKIQNELLRLQQVVEV